MIKSSIVLVPFPFDDFSSTKVRLALCLTSEIGLHGYVIIAFISSKIPNELIDSDFVIIKNSDFWIGTGLNVDSVIRLHKIVSIPKSLIKRRLGRISFDLEKAILRRLYRFLRTNKTASNRWMKSTGNYPNFTSWAEGSGSFTYAFRDKNLIANYIANQKLHHLKTSFEDEYRA